MRDLTKSLGFLALAGCIATAAPATLAFAQQRAPAQRSATVSALVVMTPNGPATCATWVQWRSPTGNSADRLAIEYWVEGYLSGLAAGTHRDVIGAYTRDALAAWLDRHCAANPQTKLPLAVHALAVQMIVRHGGPL